MSNQDKIKKLIDLRAEAKLGGGLKRIEAQHKKGKFTARAKNRTSVRRRKFRRI